MTIENQENAGESQEFATIRKLAAEVDGAAHEAVNGEAPQPGPQAMPIDPAESWAEIPRMLGGMLAMAMPELQAVYTPQACYQWGAAMSKVAQKRGWQMDGMPPEVTAVAITGMMLFPTAAAIKARADAARRQREAQERADRETPHFGGADAAAPAAD